MCGTNLTKCNIIFQCPKKLVKHHLGELCNIMANRRLANRRLANRRLANRRQANCGLANYGWTGKSSTGKSSTGKSSTANRKLANCGLANCGLANRRLANRRLANRRLANRRLANYRLGNRAWANRHMQYYCRAKSSTLSQSFNRKHSFLLYPTLIALPPSPKSVQDLLQNFVAKKVKKCH